MASEPNWMTRREAAQYLRVSTRQLDRLRLPRSTLGARPRYSREMLDEHLQRRMTAPAERTKGGPVKPPYLSPGRRAPTDIKKLIDSLRPPASTSGAPKR